MRQLAPSGVSRPVAVADVPVLWRLVDDIQDAAALADEDGTIALATRRLAEMFGYEPAGLAGRPVECLIPARLRAAHRRHRAAYDRAPATRPMGAGARLTGLRRDGTTFPVEISLSPVTIAGRRYTLTTIREIAQALRLENLGCPPGAQQERPARQPGGTILPSLIQARSCLQAALGQPGEVTGQHILTALGYLDDAIRVASAVDRGFPWLAGAG